MPLSEGGRPRPISPARATLALLESLLERFPPLGLIRETYHLVRLAKSMEKNGPESGRRVSEFDRLFRIALRSVVDTLLDAAREWDRDRTAQTEPLVEVLRKIADSFLTIWVQHSQTLRLSAIEAVMDDSEWRRSGRSSRSTGASCSPPTSSPTATSGGCCTAGSARGWTG